MYPHIQVGLDSQFHPSAQHAQKLLNTDPLIDMLMSDDMAFIGLWNHSKPLFQIDILNSLNTKEMVLNFSKSITSDSIVSSNPVFIYGGQKMLSRSLIIVSHHKMLPSCKSKSTMRKQSGNMWTNYLLTDDWLALTEWFLQV